jgi:hypothetical protein
MTYALPLATRRRIAQRRNARYRTDPDYRLKRINDARAQRGASPIASLDELGRSGNPTGRRDQHGRYA